VFDSEDVANGSNVKVGEPTVKVASGRRGLALSIKFSVPVAGDPMVVTLPRSATVAGLGTAVIVVAVGYFPVTVRLSTEEALEAFDLVPWNSALI